MGGLNMRTNIFHSVNSGLYFWSGRTGLLVDGIHRGRDVGFSNMPGPFAEQLQRGSGIFAHLNGLVFTHMHEDHFDPLAVERFLYKRSNTPVYGPKLKRREVFERPIRQGLCNVRLNDIHFLAKSTVHDGEEFRAVPHNTYLFRLNGENFFVAGDAMLNKADAVVFSSYWSGPIAAAFVNLYQLGSPEGQLFLRLLKPERIFLYHLPMEEDDRYCYHSTARHVLAHRPEDLPRAEVLKHMTWVDDHPPQWDERKEV